MGKRQRRRAAEVAASDDVREAYEEAARTAVRASLMGMLGFGLAFMMFVIVSSGRSLIGEGLFVEKLLLAGGLSGGLVFTIAAQRASSTARYCKELLEGRR